MTERGKNIENKEIYLSVNPCAIAVVTKSFLMIDKDLFYFGTSWINLTKAVPKN